MLSILFSNYLKSYKSKIADCVEFHIENITICGISNRIDIFSPQNKSVIYNYIFL